MNTLFSPVQWNAQQTSQLFQKALNNISKTIQIGIYFQLVKFLIVLGALIFNFCFCKVSDIDGWAIIFLLDVAYTLVHTKNYKLQLGDNEKIQNIAITLGQANADLMHPSRIEIQQMAYNVRKLIMTQNLDLQRESKYLMILGQILVFRFIVILTKYPFTINVFDYFDGHCNDTLLQICMIMFISFLIEFIAIYFLVIFVTLSIPIIIVLLLYRRLRKYIEIYRAKRYLNSFQTHNYLGETDEWTKNQNECSICMQEYKADEKIMRLPCNSLHMFHQVCIKSWFEVSTECPLCRTKLISQNQEQI